MSRPIFTANLDTLITGVMPGVNEEHVPLWVTAQDVLMEDAGIRPMPGFVRPYVDNGYFDDQLGMFDDYAGLFDSARTRVFLDAISSDVVKGIHVQKQSTGKLLVVWGTDTALYTFDGLSVVDASRPSPYSGTSVASDIVDYTQWSFAQWGDWVLATNGADAPQVLKAPGATEFVDLAGFPASTAQIVRVLGPHAIFFNCSGTYTPTSTPCAQNQMIWCMEDDVEQYDPTAGNLTAGELTIRDFPGPILAVEYLGGGMVAYGESSAHTIRYGGQFIFGAERGAQALRASGKNGVASVGAKHFVISQSGIFGTDGIVFAPAAYPGLGNWLEKNVDWSQKSRIAHLVDVRRNIVMWSLPGADRDFVLVYHWLNDKITMSSRVFSAGTRVESLWRPLAGFFTGELQMLIDAPSDRAPVLETKPLMVGNRTQHAFMDAFVARWRDGPASVRVKYAEAQDELEGLAWEDLGAIVGKENILFMLRETMFVQFQITSDDDHWVLSGIEILGTAGGGRL